MISNNLKLIATVSLDFYTNNIKTINVKQYDHKSRYIQVSFAEHGKRVKLNKDTMSVIARYKKADGKFGLQDCEILDDGTVMIQTTEQMLAVSGKCRLDIVILESNGLHVENFCDVTSFDDIDCAILSTMLLDLNVIPCPVNDGELQSEYNFTALNSALAETKAAEEDLIAKHAEWKGQEAARQENENARIKAEKVRERNVQDTIDKCNKKINDAVSNADDATAAATNAATAASTASTEANVAKTNANTATQNCQNVYKQISEDAGTVIAECETARDRANAAAQDCEDIVAGVSADWEATEVSRGAIKNKPPIEKGNGKNSIKQSGDNQAIGMNSIALGESCVAGCRGYYIQAVDFVNNRIYLTDTETKPISVLTELIDADASFVTPLYNIEEELVKFNIVGGGVAHWVPAGTIKSVSNNVIEFTDANHNFNASNIQSDRSYKFFVPTCPDVGSIEASSHSIAMGLETFATGSYAFAEGYANVSSGNFSHTEGRNNVAGYASHAEGFGTQALGIRCHAEGSYTQALEGYAHAEGQETVASGLAAHSEGYLTKATQDYSHAEGDRTISSGLGAHSEGGFFTKKDGTLVSTQAIGKYSHAEGEGTIASGGASHAEGKQTEAKLYAHAEGWSTKAYGNMSHSSGYNTLANGECSHAIGSQTTANGSCAFAEGLSTIATGNYQHVHGKNNIEDTENKYITIVGNGNGATKDLRSNAHTLDWDGNAWYKSLSLGGTFDNPKVSLSYNESTGRLVIAVK